MKRVGFLLEKVADMDNLMLAFYRAQQSKACKREVQQYRDCLQENLLAMRERLLSGTLEVGVYHTFKIQDPKERIICAASFDERVLHHALMQVCHVYFEKKLISDTYATRIEKGTYKAIERAHGAMKKYQYVTKLDVRKYFDSIDHDILKKQLLRIFKDRMLLDVLFKIIDSYHTKNNQGLPIGNLTSQYFANHYLSSLDHYAKEKLRVPVYVRYMDDILLFGDDRQLLREQVASLVLYVNTQLNLAMKAPIISSCVQGVSFLGYKLHGRVIGLNSRSRNRFGRKMHNYHSCVEQGQWNQSDYQGHVIPLLAFTRHAWTKKYRKRVLDKVENRRAPTV